MTEAQTKMQSLIDLLAWINKYPNNPAELDATDIYECAYTLLDEHPELLNEDNEFTREFKSEE